MSYLQSLWQKEPARVVGVIIVILDAALAIAVGYGVHVLPVVQTQIDLVGGTIITLIGTGVVIRSQVTPVAKLAVPPAVVPGP